MDTLTCLLFLSCVFAGSIDASNIENYTKLINSLLQNENRSSIVNVYSCWTRSENLYFSLFIDAPVNFLRFDSDQYQWLQRDEMHQSWFVVDMDCSGSWDILLMMEPRYFAHPFTWILLNANAANDSILSQMHIMMDSNIVWVAEDQASTSTIRQAFKREQTPNQLVWESFGIWTLNDGLRDIRETRVLARRRRNLMGLELVASMVIVHNDSLDHLTDFKDTHVDSITKSTYLIIENLLYAINATRLTRIVPTWGYKDAKTQRYSGMMGDLTERRAHIGGTSMFFTSERVALVDYVSMTTSTFAAFVFRAPSLSYTSNIYYLPLSTTVWICSICLVFLATLIVYLTYRYSARKSDSQNTNTNSVSISDFVLLAVSTVCQMGSQFYPKRMSGRISTMFFCMGMLFIYTSYTANIVALLQSSSNAISSLDDLLQSNMKFGVEDTPYSRFYFPAQTEVVRKAIYQQKIIGPNQPAGFTSLAKGVAGIRQGLFAFHMELSTGYKLIEETFYEHEKCGLTEIDYLNLISPWFVVQKNSPYKELIKITLFKIREHGLQARVQSQIYTKRPLCVSNGQNFESVRIIDCYSAFFILLYGFALSILFLIAELLLQNGHVPKKCWTNERN